MIVAALAVSAGLYAWGLYRIARARRPFPVRAIVCFGLGLAVLGAALLGPLDDLSDASLSCPMVQHFSPRYEASLENETIHAFEHALYLGSALLFWTPLLAVAPAPHAPTHPVRLLALFLALPMSAFLGFTFYVSRHVLYAHYAVRAGALDDQMNAGAVMWIAGGLPLFVALLWIVADWGARERRFEPIVDGGL